MIRESDNVTFRTPLVTNSKKAFAGFHVEIEKPLDISFNTNQKSGAVAIEFQTDQGIKNAQKVGVPQKVSFSVSGVIGYFHNFSPLDISLRYSLA